MYELIQAGENTYYFQCMAKVGLYKENDTQVTLIDSGSDEEAARKINQVLKANGWEPAHILCTHSNADHVGGNAFFQKRYPNCQLIGTGMENAVIQFPELEPAFLFGGYPPKALRSKFLMAKPSVTAGTPEEGLPAGITAISLPGHFFDMAGFRTADDVVFLADSLDGTYVLEKYHVAFLYDLKRYLETLDTIETMQARLFVPAHGEAAQDIRPLVQKNRDKIMEIIALLLNVCKTPRTTDEVIQCVFEHYGLTLDFNQYVLVGSTLRSYLSCLLDDGRLAVDFSGNKLTWNSL
ncbi:MAG: MBL fold metallo-hydrolase [Eubacteriales bacterium]|nr:MBL fold metallo-hydrolase [Eubacteriales bacterium]